MHRDTLQKLRMKFRPAGIRNERRSLATEGCTYCSRSWHWNDDNDVYVMKRLRHQGRQQCVQGSFNRNSKIFFSLRTAGAQIWSLTLCQEGTNPRHQVSVATKFCTVAPNVCGSSVWNLLQVILLALQFWGCS
jgi:hypothetical protein